MLNLFFLPVESFVLNSGERETFKQELKTPEWSRSKSPERSNQMPN
jgi:hypothetical protein